MSLLIIGEDSLIGRSLKETCIKHNLPYYGTSRKRNSGRTIPLDMLEAPSSWKFPPGIKVAVICAATTKISLCEEDPIQARRMNVEAPVLLARMLQERGVAVIFLSTSLVFGGHIKAAKWDDPLQPATIYGHQKAEAESLMRETGPQVAILRITKIVYPSLPLFTEWAGCLKNRLIIEPFSDIVFSPIPISLVTEVILGMVKEFKAGIFQLSGDRDITYAEAATLFAQHLQTSPSFIQPRSSQSAGFNVPFIPPLHTTMTPYLPYQKVNSCPSVEETLISVFDHFKS